MKILLVKPPNVGDHIQPPLGLGYLATALREKNDVGIVDCQKSGFNNNNLLKYVEQFEPDIIGIQLYTSDIETVRQLLAKIKSLNADIVTIVGGPHPSACPDDAFALFGDTVDYGFAGEAENGISLLIDRVKNKSNKEDVPGLIWR